MAVESHKGCDTTFDIDKLTAHHLIAVVQSRRKDGLTNDFFERELTEAQAVFPLYLRKIGELLAVSARNREKHIAARNLRCKIRFRLNVYEFIAAFQLANDIADQSGIECYLSFFANDTFHFGRNSEFGVIGNQGHLVFRSVK